LAKSNYSALYIYSGAFSASIGCNAHISVDKSLAVADLVIFEGDCIKTPALLKVKTKKKVSAI